MHRKSTTAQRLIQRAGSVLDTILTAHPWAMLIMGVALIILAGTVWASAALALTVDSYPVPAPQAVTYAPSIPWAVPLPPCAAEDSPGPCYWDAATRGNGHGTSFIAVPGA